MNGFDDPRTFFPWWFDAGEADRLIAEKRAQAGAGLDLRDLRRALGQFATGVTIVTTRSEDGHRLVRDRQLVRVALARPAPRPLVPSTATAGSLPRLPGVHALAVNVPAPGQHNLSRVFATCGRGQFAGVDALEGPAGLPLPTASLAYFVCRNVRQIEAGDHVILIGEVERYETFPGEPLVFHSGFYRVATRHPELEQA